MKKTTLLRNTLAMIIALFTFMFVLPQKAQAEDYGLRIAGKQVTSANCKNLTAIPGVTGKASYNPSTKTLTLDNATIHTTVEEYNGYGIQNKIDGLTIRLTGKNTITSDKSTGIFNSKDIHLTLTGSGSLKVNGSTTAENINFRTGIYNRSYITVKGCTLEATGGLFALTGGYWTFDNCTVRAKGGGSVSDDNQGSIGQIWDKPTFKGCAITQPTGTTWYQFAGITYHSLFGANGKALTDWVTIEPIKYDLTIAGTQVTSANCADLTAIPGVTGKASFDPATRTLTLDNATIHTTAEEEGGIGIYNEIDGLTIRLIGNSTVTSDKSRGMYNDDYIHLTLTGSGSLKVNGSTMAEKEKYRRGIVNRGYLTVKGCTVEASGGRVGLSAGYWTFDNCTMRAKGGDGSDEYAGSITWMWDIPTFIGCAVTRPAGATWHEFQSSYGTYYSLYGADGKVVTNWVTIATAGAHTKEAYVVKSTDMKTLTFYYDTQRDTRTGANVWDIDETVKDEANDEFPIWSGFTSNDNQKIEKVVFDPSFKDYAPTSLRCWFIGCAKLTTFEGISHLNTSQVTSMESMFANCDAITSLNLSGFNTSQVTSMKGMFYSCYALKELNLSSFNTENVATMRNMFTYCYALKELNLSSFNTEKVISMAYLFYHCEALKKLNLSSFNTEKVIRMEFMFSSCTALEKLDLTNFNTEKVIDMVGMFSDCSALTTIYCNDTWTCDESNEMFSQCPKLKGAVAYDADKTDATMANPETGYFTKKNVTGISTVGLAAEASKQQGIYNLRGVRLGTSLDALPKGVYIVKGKKVVKK